MPILPESIWTRPLWGYYHYISCSKLTIFIFRLLHVQICGDICFEVISPVSLGARLYSDTYLQLLGKGSRVSPPLGPLGAVRGAQYDIPCERGPTSSPPDGPSWGRPDKRGWPLGQQLGDDWCFTIPTVGRIGAILGRHRSHPRYAIYPMLYLTLKFKRNINLSISVMIYSFIRLFC